METFDTIDYPLECLLNLIIKNESTELYYSAISDYHINKNDFKNPNLLKIFNIITDICADEGKITKDLLISKFKTKKLKTVYDEILKLDVGIDNFKYFCEKIKKNSNLSNIKEYCLNTLANLNNFADQDFELNPDDLIQNFEDISLKITNNSQQSFIEPSNIVPDLFNIIKNGEPESILTTPWSSLNDMLNGLPNDYCILGGRPGLGKSAACLNILLHNAVDRNIRCAMFSLEMSSRQLGMRSLAYLSGVDLYKIKRGDLDATELQLVEDAAKRFAKAPLHIDPTPGLTAKEICARAQRLKIKYPDLQFIIIDHMHKVGGSDNELAKLNGASNDFFNLRKKLDIGLLLLVQLNRNLEADSRKEKRPGLSDIRGSGALEQDGAVIMLLHSDNYFDKSLKKAKIWPLEIIVAKNRDGALGTIDLKFNRLTQTMEE